MAEKEEKKKKKVSTKAEVVVELSKLNSILLARDAELAETKLKLKTALAGFKEQESSIIALESNIRAINSIVENKDAIIKESDGIVEEAKGALEDSFASLKVAKSALVSARRDFTDLEIDSVVLKKHSDLLRRENEVYVKDLNTKDQALAKLKELHQKVLDRITKFNNLGFLSRLGVNV
tara:strand:+ start:4168 stop:4704 length:537 start_codon:yes stop_codon:yes gene_type:complete